MDQDSIDKTTADQLIAEAGQLEGQGRDLEAADLYLRAAMFDPYGSFALVAGDIYRSAGRLKLAEVAYRRTIEVVPEHDQAWHGLGWALLSLGATDEGREALVRSADLAAAFGEGEIDAAIDRFWDSSDPLERGRVITRIAPSTDDRVRHVLHAHLEMAQRYGTDIGGLDHWASVATVLVRFGVTDHLDWYTDGPAPSRDWLFEDLERYLATHEGPPNTVWPIAYSHSDALPRSNTTSPSTSFWRRLFRRESTKKQ